MSCGGITSIAWRRYGENVIQGGTQGPNSVGSILQASKYKTRIIGLELSPQPETGNRGAVLGARYHEQSGGLYSAFEIGSRGETG